MKLRVFVLPYKLGSQSAKSIAKYFDFLRIRPDGNYNPRNGDIILNWGYGGPLMFRKWTNQALNILNDPKFVSDATNKIKTLKIFTEAGIPTLEYCLTKKEAELFIDSGFMVYCRTVISGKGGNGIIIAKTKEELVDCLLYTKEFKNNREYRVHVFNGEVIDVARKRKMSEESMAEHGINPDEVSKEIRNLNKGWIFSREELVVEDCIKDVAINAIKALNLTFGACDILFHTKTKSVAVIEVNTACGMEEGSTTHMRYVYSISKLLNIPFSIDEYNTKYNCDLKFGLLNE